MILSVIIPVFNEEERIGNNLKKINNYLSKKYNLDEYEIIIVDDGSQDATVKMIEELKKDIPNLILIKIYPNQGKGNAVKVGMLASKGKYCLFTDADLSTPIEEMEKLFFWIKNGYQVVISSRALKDSQVILRQPFYREFMGKTFNKIVRSLGLVKGIKDTQCGFKLFTGEAAKEIFRDLKTKNFAFDVEALFLARKKKYKIKEVGVKWINSPQTKVKAFTDSLKMFFSLLKIRFNN